MKSQILTTLIAFTATGFLCSFIPAATHDARTESEPRVTAEHSVEAVVEWMQRLQDEDAIEPITGKFHLWGMGHGYVYFSLDGKPIRMLEADFPNPIPANGTILTASGLTKDFDGGYTCTKLK